LPDLLRSRPPFRHDDRDVWHEMRDGLQYPRRERVGIRLIGPDEPRRAIPERKKERARPRTLRDDLTHEIRPRDWLDPRKRLRDRRDNVGCEIVRRDLVVGPD